MDEDRGDERPVTGGPMVMLRTTQAHRPDCPVGGRTFGSLIAPDPPALPRTSPSVASHRGASGHRSTSQIRRLRMLDGRWLYVATVPVAVWILSRRAAPGRRLVALIALAHVAILANVSLFPVPVDPAVVAAGRAAANASAGGGGLRPL